MKTVFMKHAIGLCVSLLCTVFVVLAIGKRIEVVNFNLKLLIRHFTVIEAFLQFKHIVHSLFFSRYGHMYYRSRKHMLEHMHKKFRFFGYHRKIFLLATHELSPDLTKPVKDEPVLYVVILKIWGLAFKDLYIVGYCIRTVFPE